MPVGAVVAIGGAVSSGMAANESKKGRKAVEAQQRRIQEMTQPFYNSGVDALNTISDPNRMMSAFKTDPGYDFRMKEGMAQVNQNKALGGLLRSGSTIKDTINYSQGVASDEYGKVYNRLFDRAQMGMQGIGVNAGTAQQIGQAAQTDSANRGNAWLTAANGVQEGMGYWGSSHGRG